MDRFAFFRMLGEAVYRVDGAYDAVSKNVGVKPSILWLVSALNDGQKHSQNQLCWDWNYPRTTLNTLVKELEKKGFVVLNPVPGARRELYVELTEEGKAFADQVLRPVYEAEERLYREYFMDHDMEFVRQLNDFSTEMKRAFSKVEGGSAEQEE